ncbi:MAG TPA: energy-coupling factor ABC transporter permease [Kiritimatiellia bacterium]|nr:energy-coupling factor ABC transporter permease [Kiritimatiellia bacterium]HRZ13577.1 energy-coupling factor ABC transporter permease [Kiritimatiellia bacterium]HSA19327.1 energy-coupling factor ABC transporter permease [Kiritimatiellia bacterium]
MHMADALISPAVGGTMWAASAGLLAWCARKIRQTLDHRLVPMMGVLGAFIFASQMINFSIPGTGSSGHLGGGLILAILLGPHAAFLVIASVLTVQALFFADGGLLALGCNIWNLGFYPAFIAFPFIYKPLAGANRATPRAWAAAILAAVIGLQLGAFSVVLETTASGISELPFGSFVLLMSPVHLAIGIVEGLATATVVAFVARARPEAVPSPAGSASLKPALIGLGIAALIVGGAVSWFASAHPDGLEWSIAKVSGREEVGGGAALHEKLARVQEKTAFLPDYGFQPAEEPAAEGEPGPEPWPAVSAGTTVSGVVGGLLVLLVAGAAGLALRPRRVAS